MTALVGNKHIALSDKITIDGVDVSNMFHSFGLSSDGSDTDVSGFSASGTDETLTGPKAQGFSGDVYITPEVVALLWPIHTTNEIVEVSWQPDGLINDNFTPWHGNCQLRTFDPSNTRGDAAISPVTFKVADDLGITQS